MVCITCSEAALLGDFWLFLPSKYGKQQLARTPFKTSGSGTSVFREEDSSKTKDETLLFDVSVPEEYKDVVSNGKEEMVKLLLARIQSESVTVGKGGAYKVWLSPTSLVVALRVFPVGYRVFLLRQDEDEEEEEEGSKDDEGVFSVVDLERGTGKQTCKITTRVSLSSPSATTKTISAAAAVKVKVSINCVSRRLDAGLKKRLLAAVREAWQERLERDVALCTARLAQLRTHAAAASIAGMERRKAENDKILNPPKPISPTVRRPGGGGRLNLGGERKAKHNVQRVVRRGG
jgi:hypothetical protein